MEGLSACECPVCFLLLNHSSHEPISMPCGHTLCKVCVEQLGGRASNRAVARPTFQCPICRLWVNVDAVSLNVTLRDLLAELGKMDEKRTLPLGTALNAVYSEVAVEEVLDRGAFGEVCRGRWRGNEVAVKLFCTGRPTPETMEAFQREVFVMNCLRHPNVVLLLGACQTPPKLAIIMEFVAGGSLHQLIHVDKRLLSVSETAQLATDICRGLQYLHSINILHRDMKSKNVLLTGRIPCQAKLCDFGLARMRQESATMTGNIGTVHWTAPEVLNNLRYQFPADVYGFGMVVYEMVCGRVPHADMVPMAVMLAVAVRKQRPVVPDDAHPTLQQLIKDSSEWEPVERPSLSTMLASLAELLPPTHRRGKEQGGEGGSRRGKLEHQDSLGVVFLSATDSADLAKQDSSLAELARLNQVPPSLQQATPPLLQQKAPPIPQQAPPIIQLRKRSYEDLFLSHDNVPPPVTEDTTSLNMAVQTQLNHPLGHYPPPHRPLRHPPHHYPPPHRPLHHPPHHYPPPHWPLHHPPHHYPPPHRPLHHPPHHYPPHHYALNPENEVTSYNMAIEDERRHYLGEGNAPWPQYKTQQQQQQQQGTRGEGTGGEGIGGEELVYTTAALDIQAQLEADRHLAEQLQMKEHSFQLAADPVATPHSVFPPQPLLDTIKSKKFPRLKHVEDKATPTESDPEPLPLRKRLGSMLSKTMFKSRREPAKEMTHESIPALTKHQKKQKARSVWSHDKDRPTRPTAGKEVTVGAMPGNSHTLPPPPAPPLPPPPPPQGMRMLSPRQLMLKEVQTRAPTVARQLRPVETIEKRAFRIGHVVGGYVSERDQFTMQNMIESFNRHRLRRVTVRDPPPAFPVGRVVQSRHQVKRISSLLDSSLSPVNGDGPPPPLPPIQSSPPRRRLHPAIRSAVEKYSKASLHHVKTVVKQSLPDKRELEQDRRSKFIQEIAAFDHSLLVTVETVVKNTLPSADVLDLVRQQAEDSDLTHTRDLVLQSVLTFDPSGLHHVVTEVKNHLPSIGAIELERSLQGEP